MRRTVADVISSIQDAPALQQPDWSDRAQVERVRATLSARDPLVSADQTEALRRLLARVVAGEAYVVQCGDCAEDPSDCSAEDVRRKAAVLELVAGTLTLATGKPVIRVGRIAGQFAKPRSQPVERVGDLVLPAYRGHMVNGPRADLVHDRRPDPLRILTGYMAASEIMLHLGWRGPRRPGGAEPDRVIWTSHEALLLDYEMPMLRKLDGGALWLSSTHWPWIGDRTRQVDGAHVALLAGIVNPVACKVGPTVTAAELIDLCGRLDPEREAGRLTLIARMGADRVADRLPWLVDAVRAAGHPAIWLCDPMHGNTITTPDGRKTRLVDRISRELGEFRLAVASAGGVAGGVHLETTPEDVTECVADAGALGTVGARYTSLCDPRLTPWQAMSVVSMWTNPPLPWSRL